MEKFSLENSRIYPGTKRSCWIQPSAQYEASKPACLMPPRDGWLLVATAISVQICDLPG